MIGHRKPNSRMLAAISPIWSSEWVRGLRSRGVSRSVFHSSIRVMIIGTIASASLTAAVASAPLNRASPAPSAAPTSAADGCAVVVVLLVIVLEGLGMPPSAVSVTCL